MATVKTLIGNIRGKQGDPGAKGEPGVKGEDGVSITSIEQTTKSTEPNGTNIVTITLSDGTKATFEITNGSGGKAENVEYGDSDVKSALDANADDIKELKNDVDGLEPIRDVTITVNEEYVASYSMTGYSIGKFVWITGHLLLKAGAEDCVPNFGEIFTVNKKAICDVSFVLDVIMGQPTLIGLIPNGTGTARLQNCDTANLFNAWCHFNFCYVTAD